MHGTPEDEKKRNLSFRAVHVFRGLMSSGPVAVIDIGSNSIKVLVATRAEGGGLRTLLSRTIDARISAGLSRAAPHLSEAGMESGLQAVRALLAEAAAFSPARMVLVATSAVRDAQNGAEFRDRLRLATGHDIRILSGHEEANLIGLGLSADPALRGLQDFYVFDLGGGSLECLAFRERRIGQAVSLPLGCVRLTERFVRDPALPLTETARAELTAHARETLTRAGFAFSLPAGAVAIGTGGTVATARAIFGARDRVPFESTNPVVTVAQLQELLAWIGALPLAQRQAIAGLPPARADVFPVALVTLIAVFEVGGFSSCQNSLHTLRHGLADEALAALE